MFHRTFPLQIMPFFDGNGTLCTFNRSTLSSFTVNVLMSGLLDLQVVLYLLLWSLFLDISPWMLNTTDLDTIRPILISLVPQLLLLEELLGHALRLMATAVMFHPLPTILALYQLNDVYLLQTIKHAVSELRLLFGMPSNLARLD